MAEKWFICLKINLICIYFSYDAHFSVKVTIPGPNRTKLFPLPCLTVDVAPIS